MSTTTSLTNYGTSLLALGGGLLVLAGITLSALTRFIQFRAIGKLTQLFTQPAARTQDQGNLISPLKALFTAMSTTIGIASIVAPVVAIKLGGPGALLGFILTMIFGSATTFVEVAFALKYRTHDKEGTLTGGPMHYLSRAVGAPLALWYATGITLLLTAWSANQSNTITDVLQPYGVAPWLSGLVITCIALLVLHGGIQRVGTISEIVIPIMFVTFVGGSLWILGTHLHALPHVFWQVVTNSLDGTALAAGCSLGGFTAALRWGLLKGIHTTEAGLGTATVPHSMAATSDPHAQGMLATLSVWSVGFVSLLSGLVVLATGVYKNPTLGIGVNVLIEAFAQEFSSIGRIVLTTTAFLKAFGTIVGNCYNAGQCLAYLTSHRFVRYYYLVAGLVIFIGSTLDIAFVWAAVDVLAIPIALPHVYALIKLAWRERSFIAP